MKLLGPEQLRKLTPQRRKALLRAVTARFAKVTDNLDFESDLLSSELQQINNYRKRIRRMVRKDRALSTLKTS